MLDRLSAKNNANKYASFYKVLVMKKMFLTLTIVSKLIKLFSPTLMLQSNKLERLST
jgi:hypothetical protein